MNHRKWHILLILLALAAATTVLGWWLLATLLRALAPWFSVLAPAMTRGELGLILGLLAIVCVSWNDRR